MSFWCDLIVLMGICLRLKGCKMGVYHGLMGVVVLGDEMVIYGFG